MAKKTNRWVALGTLGVMTASTFGGLGITAAHAGSEGRRNTALALGAVTLYGLLKKNKTAAIGGALVTAWAYKRYSNERRRERERYNRWLYRQGRFGRYSLR